MRLRPVIVAVAVAAAVAIYWSPLSINVGDYVYRLGGYPWTAPNERARAIFIGIGLALSAGGAALVALELKLSREIEEMGEV